MGAVQSTTLQVQDFFNGEVHELEVVEGDTISAARERLAEVSGVHVERQRLYCDGKRLLGTETFAELGRARLVLVRLPTAALPEDDEVFVDGDLDNGGINVRFLFDHFEHEGRLTCEQAEAIIERAKNLLTAGPSVVTGLSEPAVVVGDIHGQWFDLQTLTEAVDAPFFDDGRHWIFNGDYVDRGRFSSEVALLVLALKVNEPTRFTLLRGNHESQSQMKKQGTRREFEKKYRDETFEQIVDCFHALPVAAVVTCADKRLFCCHGGIGPRVGTLASLEADIGDRFCEPSANKVIRDITWSDPTDSAVAPKPAPAPAPEVTSPVKKRARTDANKNKIPSLNQEWDLSRLQPAPEGSSRAREEGLTPAIFEPNPSRGSSIAAYTVDALHTFLAKNDILTILRGHEQKDGVEFGVAGPKYDFPSFCTVFSAPNYTDKSKNRGAVVLLEDGKFKVREFTWRLHPAYTSNNERDLERDDFHVSIYHVHPAALRALTEDELDEAYSARFPIERAQMLGKQDLWLLLANNLECVPDLAKSSYDDLTANAVTLAEWFSKVDHLRRGIVAEAENELEILTTDEEEDEDNRPYRTPDATPDAKGAGKKKHRKKSHRKSKKHSKSSRFRAAFELFDADGSGEIDVSELRKVLWSLGRSVTDNELQDIIDRYDRNNDHVMQYREFKAFLKSEAFTNATRREQSIKQAWDVFDQDKSGFLSAEELQRVMALLSGQRISDLEIAAMLDRADASGDAQLSFEEFEFQIQRVDREREEAEAAGSPGASEAEASEAEE